MAYLVAHWYSLSSDGGNAEETGTGSRRRSPKTEIGGSFMSKPGLIPRRIVHAFSEFDKLESSGSIVLVSAAVAAVILANTSVAASFLGFWTHRIGTPPLELSLRGWINDGLMALFFFLVGLEIKRELMIGELSTARQAMLPILAAVGGMAVPALIYAGMNVNGQGRDGWGIPMATDIAFSLGVLALLGSRIPIGIKVFLTALAIADDLGAVLVIALFYTPGLHIEPLLLAFVGLAGIYVVARIGFDSPWLFILLGPIVWFLVHESGIHATLAGVVLAFTVPAKRRVAGEAGRVLEFSLIEGMLHGLHPWVTYAVVPLFALANAGVSLARAPLSGSIAWGIVLGLAVGKPLGVFVFSLAAVKFGMASLPRGVTWAHVLGAGILAGIGFTMSLFIAELAFGEGAQLDVSKIGIFVASIVSAVVGYGVMAKASPPELGEEEPSAAKDPDPPETDREKAKMETDNDFEEASSGPPLPPEP